MYRDILKDLKRWKEKKDKKPLIIEGARQVGKTWIMQEFGKQCYERTVYLNFDENRQMSQLFAEGIAVEKIIAGLEIFAEQKIDENTLIILDEIQESPRALASLKYFCEKAPYYSVVCAGSMLGIALHGGTSFPVGKVEFLKLYPLSFTEFLQAIGQEKLCKLIENRDFEMLNTFKNLFSEFLRTYYFVGGMPEAVQRFIDTKNYSKVREIQKRILESYEHDFSKHAPYAVVPQIRMIWDSIPSQLAKENKKFIYGLVREGARAREYETAIMWLEDCGLVYKVNRVQNALLPLKAYEDLKAFKLFIVDVGLLGCKVGIAPKILLEGNKAFVEFKGALTEQYVLQQLKGDDRLLLFYYTNDRNSCEVDFLADNGETVIPLEVKAEENLQAKSLKSYCEKFRPEKAVRASMSGYRRENYFINIPLFAISLLNDLE